MGPTQVAVNEQMQHFAWRYTSPLFVGLFFVYHCTYEIGILPYHIAVKADYAPKDATGMIYTRRVSNLSSHDLINTCGPTRYSLHKWLEIGLFNKFPPRHGLYIMPPTFFGT